jgi:hypothetical protein
MCLPPSPRRVECESKRWDLKSADCAIRAKFACDTAANNTAAISPTGGTGLMASGATTSTLPVSTGMARQTDETTVLLKESNTYLKAIASNTAAFAGVLT